MNEYGLQPGPETSPNYDENLELFQIVAGKLEEALGWQRQDPHNLYVAITDGPQPNQALAVFTVVEDFAKYRHNQGEIIEIESPMFKINDQYSALMLLHPLNQGHRFFTVRHFRAGKTRSYYFTDSTPRRHVPRSLDSKIRDFKVAYRRPRTYFDEEQAWQ